MTCRLVSNGVFCVLFGLSVVLFGYSVVFFGVFVVFFELGWLWGIFVSRFGSVVVGWLQYESIGSLSYLGKLRDNTRSIIW